VFEDSATRKTATYAGGVATPSPLRPRRRGRRGRGGAVSTHINEGFNPTIYQDVKKTRQRAVVAEGNMALHL